MTSLAAAQVVRRSALEDRHLALSARWVAEDIHWPLGYGSRDVTADTTVVADTAGLAEIGPLDELLLRGPGALALAARLATDTSAATIGRAVAANLRDDTGELWLLGPDEVLLLATSAAAALATLATELASSEVSAIEMTGARTSLRLAGPAAPAILAELCPVDTSPATLAPGDLLQAPLAGVRTFIVQRGAGAHPGYTIMVARDEAAHVWDALRHVGTPHGLAPVGPAAVAPGGIA